MSPAVLLHVALGQSEVCQLDVALTIQQHILWLQVTVSNATAVQVGQCCNNLSSVQTSDVLIKNTLQHNTGHVVTEVPERLAHVKCIV